MSEDKRYLFTSESVTEGHPDKMADRISDAILDAMLKDDPDCRVAVETLVATGMALVAGEVKTNCYVDIPKVVREAIKWIGYTDSKMGFDWESCAVMVGIDEQSPDISQGVTETEGREQGAGDQGLMFGYATNETPELMPYPIMMAHKLSHRLAEVRKDGTLDYLGPDGKSQVTIEYEGRVPKRIEAIVLAAQHRADIELPQIQEDLKAHVIDKIVPQEMIDSDTKMHINATGKFVMGGPRADAGLTGRKIIVDTYGGMGRHGGGAFSGKDPSKVDRSASYAARWIAKNVVAAGLADECEVQLAYAIGVAKPVSVTANTNCTANVPEEQIEALINKHFDMTPKAIIECLQLKRPIYKDTSSYGHFGRDNPNFTWEKTDRADELHKDSGL